MHYLLFCATFNLLIAQEATVACGQAVGVDLSTGEAMIPADAGIYDNYIVKRSLLHSWYYSLLFITLLSISLSLGSHCYCQRIAQPLAILIIQRCDCQQSSAGGRGDARGHRQHKRVVWLLD